MGYHTSPRLIEENVETLRAIREAVSSGREVRFRVLDDRMISTEQYRLRRALAACDRHRTVFGGEFAGLGAAVTIKVEPETGTLVVSPRAAALQKMEELRPDENVALSALAEAKGSLTLLEFFPSPEFSLSSLAERAREIGWEIAPSTQEISSEGKISVIAERVEPAGREKGGFELLDI